MNKYNLIFIGATQNYPHNISACNTKISLLSKYLIKSGNKTLIINSLLGSNKSEIIESDVKDLTDYYCFNKHKYLLKTVIYNIFNLFLLLKENKLKNKKNIIILDYDSYPFFLLYVLFGRILGFKIGGIYHEYHISFETNNYLKKISNYLFDITFGYFVDFILPISEFLIKDSIKFNKPIHKLPILADFLSLNNNSSFPLDYYTYVGHADYSRAIDYLIDGVSLNGNINLKLVLHGNENKINYYYNRIKKLKNYDKFEIIKNLSSKDLFSLLSSSKCNIIPLFENNLQDKARFSQKIAEYISTGRPILANNFGEIPYYFTNNLNSFLLYDNNPENLSKKINEINNLSVDAINEVGVNGYLVGKKKFDAKKNVNSFITFLDKTFNVI